MAQDNDDLLVPQADSALKDLKFEVAREVGVAQRAGSGTGLTQQNYDQVLDKFKNEIAGEIGILDEVNRRGWADMPSRQCGRVGGLMGGAIGGQMVKRMIALAEEHLRAGTKV
ncbi:MAG TPA: alpha/beta-type small acid-soluble spore protein [Bacillota bacterium]|jgi:hypothetical protein